MKSRFSLPTVSCVNPPCGACCMEMRSPPFCAAHFTDEGPKAVSGGADSLDMSILKKLPRELYNDLRAHVLGNAPAESPCCWLDLETRLCKHYDLRPEICRNALQPGDAGCRRWRVKLGFEQPRKFMVSGGRLVKR